MSVRVSLQDIVNEMAEISDRHSAFLDRRTGELLTLNDRYFLILDDDEVSPELLEWQRKLQEGLKSGDILELPSKFEQHEYTIRERFVHSIKDPQQRGLLVKALRGRQAFRDFDRELKRLGLDQRWIGFRTQAFEEIAVRWLDERGIAYDRAA